MQTTSAPRVLVMGCGGIGGVISAHLAERGAAPAVVTHNATIAAAINQHGFRLRDGANSRTVSGRATAALPNDAGTFDLILLATQPPQVTRAAEAARPHLHPNGALVCLQNGLCETHVAPLIGADRVLGAIVVWGASMPEPGVYERTSTGGFVIGRLDGADDARLDTLRRVLESVGPVEVTHNLAGARWSKLAINCAITSLGTIGGQRLGELMRFRFVRRLGLEVMSEAVRVAQREGARLEKVSGTLDLAWIALTAADVSGPGSPSLLAKHAVLLAVGAKYRRLRSSMLIAIERGREPAVEFLNGEVLRRADALGLAAPVNRRVRELIHAIARREVRPSIALLRRLYEDSRAEAYAATASSAAASQPDAHA
ncbi:MAG: ketopantoate reductase family protein [bacterium]